MTLLEQLVPLAIVSLVLVTLLVAKESEALLICLYAFGMFSMSSAFVLYIVW